MNNDTRAMLLESGINPKHKAFAYLGALAEMIEVFPLKRVGYPAVAEMFGTDERSVDKAIQNAIAAAWTKGRMPDFTASSVTLSTRERASRPPRALLQSFAPKRAKIADKS